jgi:hypothetical protein
MFEVKILEKRFYSEKTYVLLEHGGALIIYYSWRNLSVYPCYQIIRRQTHKIARALK